MKFSNLSKRAAAIAGCAAMALSLSLPVFAAEAPQMTTTVGTPQSITVDTDHPTNHADMQLIINTIGRGEDGTDPTKSSFIVTIPTKIEYNNVKAGSVASCSTDYTVNVKGTIAADEKVTLSATTDNHFKIGDTVTDLTETTTQGKTEWSADEVFGDGDTMTGTDTTDNVTLSGTAKYKGQYKAIVTYTANLVSTAAAGN